MEVFCLQDMYYQPSHGNEEIGSFINMAQKISRQTYLFNGDNTNISL
jgi:hypothetical protein